MDSLYFKVALHQQESLKIEEWELPHFYSLLHFHPEYQLTIIRKSNGFLFVADKMYRFSPGDIFIIGPNIPHVFQNDDPYHDNSVPKVDAVSIFFTEKSFGEGLFSIPEAGRIKELLHKSIYGIKLSCSHHGKLRLILNNIGQKKGFDRILDLLKVLNELSLSKELEMISLLQTPTLKQKDECSKINTVYEYVLKNYHNPIHLNEISALVNMSHYSFCKFFKQRTTKTFVQFLTEVRIGMACKYLVEGKMNITEIAYQSGFSNLSNFIRQFKKLIGSTPSEYQKKLNEHQA